jgi:hypothetical protein
VGVIRKSLNFATVGAVRGSSKKQRVAAASLAAQQRQAAALEEIAAGGAVSAEEMAAARRSLVARLGPLRSSWLPPERVRAEALRLRDVDPGASSGG